MHVAELHVYPLKGAGGIALKRADLLACGLRHDRRFMLLDADLRYVTQRLHPKLALVTTAINDSSLVIAGPTGESVALPLSPQGPRRRVRIWHDDVEAISVEGPAAALLSEHLGERCTLFFMPDDVVRPVDPTYAAQSDHVGFADGFPVLLACNASLADLNARLTTPVKMDRFRANLVIEGGAAFEEDLHNGVRVGSITFRMPKRCARCPVTLVDQTTAMVSKEPLRTLATYRAVGGKVYFGQNLIPDGEGEIVVGDAVEYFGPAPS
ncbi:MAG: MOSC domain-containing protein [Polyangiales bacterium]